MTTTIASPVPRTGTRRRNPAGALGDLLLWIASIGGAICIIVVIASLGFHITLIMFKTGSMEPTIPTGSLAIVHEIPASDIRVGDVVTVDRPGELPVTHRVVSIAGTETGDGAGATRVITLRGDANPTVDAAPYTVQKVRLVWWSIPGWAQVVVWFSNPFVLGGLTVGATLLVMWAFWPREGRDGDDGPRRTRRPRRGLPRDPSTGFVTIRGISIGLAITGVFAATIFGPVPAAQAAEVETVTQSTYLKLTSISDPVLMASMTPGVPVTWQVGVDATPPDPGLVHLGIAATGALTAPGNLTIGIRACPTRWVAGVCAAGASTWLATTDLATAISPVTAFGAHEIGTMDAAVQRWLLMSVTLVAAAIPPGDSAQLRLQAWGIGSPLSTSPGGLAFTGGSSPVLPGLLAFIAVGVGVFVATFAPRRRAVVA